MALTGLIIGWAAIGLFVLLVTVGILATIATTSGTSYTTSPGLGTQHVKTIPFAQDAGHRNPKQR